MTEHWRIGVASDARHRPHVTRNPTEPASELYALFQCGSFVILLDLQVASMDVLLDYTGARGPRADEETWRVAGVTLHRCKEGVMPMQPGAQSDMVRAAAMQPYPLVIGPHGRAAWGDPEPAEIPPVKTRFGFKWSVIGEGAQSSAHVDEADIRFLRLAVAPAADVRTRFRELAAVAPELALHVVQRAALAPRHMLDLIGPTQLIGQLSMEDLAAMVRSSATGVKRVKDRAADAWWSVWDYHEQQGQQCPACSNGVLALKRTRRGKAFLGCSRYPECDYSFWVDHPPQLHKHDEVDA